MPAIHAIEKASFPAWQQWDPMDWEMRLDGRLTLLVEDAGKIAGFAALDFYGDKLRIMNFAIAPAFRGRGHGRLLMTAIEQLARAAGADAVVAETLASNTALLTRLTIEGFVQVEHLPFYGDKRGGIRLRKELQNERNIESTTSGSEHVPK